MVNQSVLEIAKRYIENIPQNLGLQKAYLFGSYAKGNQNPDSDIDIAIILSNIDNFYDTQMLLMRLRRDIDLRIEAHHIAAKDFNENNPLACEIQRTGIKIF